MDSIGSPDSEVDRPRRGRTGSPKPVRSRAATNPKGNTTRVTRAAGASAGANGTSRTSSSKKKAAPARRSTPARKAGDTRELRTQGRRTMQKLLDAAMEAFDQRGYHATRVNDVVEIAQTSHGTFYLYFSNKEDLLEALVAQAAGDAASVYAALTAEPHTGTASWEELRVWINGYSELWRRYAPLFRGWTELAATERGVRTRVLRIVSSLTSAMASQIAASGAQAGMDPRVAGMAVLAMLDRFHYMREFFGEPIDEAAIDTLTTMVHRALFDSGLGAAR